MRSQARIIIDHLEMHKCITSMEAIEKYRITRLAAVIARIKSMGYCIQTELILNENRVGHYARYWLIKGE